MFKKLLAKLRSPKKSGGEAPELGGQRWVKTYDVILANMEDSPSYPLSHQLTIGSEIGNIIINDPSVSPRHATILLQEDVISIMDHGSVAGTLVNGTKIPAGKFIILEDTDSINVGDLEVKLGIKTKVVEEPESVPPEHENLEDSEEKTEASSLEEVEESEEAVGDDDFDDENDDEEDVEEPGKEASITKTKAYMQFPGAAKAIAKSEPKKKAKLKFSLPSYDATNSLIRVMAVAADLLLSYIILVIFTPFDDFRNFLNYIPEVIAELGDFKWEDLWMIATEEAGQVTEVLKEVFSIANEIVPVLHLFLVFFLLRLITTVILGVSISEFMFGVHANFNKIWARIGGMLRVIIGMMTWPFFFILDLPSLASKRTFKEFITFTNTYVGSRVTLFFGIIFYSPILLVLLLISPMFIGLELVEPIPFSPTVSQRVKQAPEGTEEPTVQKQKVAGKYMGLSLWIDAQKTSLIPTFKFKGDKSKLNMNVGLAIYNRETDRDVTVELFKTFDMKALMKLGLSGNFLLHDQYQEVYNFAYAAEKGKAGFKSPQNPKQEEAFGKQVVGFTEMAFGLGLENMIEFMTSKTPFLKSVIDYRSALLSLLEYKDFTDLSVVKLGQILCLRATYDKQKPFDLLLPLMRSEGRIYKITYDLKEEVQQSRNELYKFTLDELVWGIPEDRESLETFNAFEVIDLLTESGKGVINTEKAQALYGYYFEKSADVLKAEKAKEFEIWKSAVNNMINVIPYLKTPEDGSADEVKAKLKSNFSDLFNALENKNKSFFGIEESPTV